MIPRTPKPASRCHVDPSDGTGPRTSSQTISIIVPTYDRGPRIRECLDGLLAQTRAAGAEVIVVDDGSTDGTAAIVAEYPDVRLIRQANAGPAAARNRGAEEAGGDLIVFVDDDCIPEPDWLEQLTAPFADAEIAGAKGAYLCRQSELVARFVQLEYEEKYERMKRQRYIDFIDTYSAVFRRDVFLAAGGYDTAFSTASVEDQELSFRLAEAGRKLVFVPEARVWHRHVDTVRGYLKKKHKIGFWKVRVVSKNPSKMAGDSHTPTSLKIQILLAALFPLCCVGFVFPPLGLGAVLAAAVAFLLTTVPLTWRCARRDPAVACVAPVLIACRAAALTAGLARGTFLKMTGDGRFRPAPEVERGQHE